MTDTLKEQDSDESTLVEVRRLLTPHVESIEDAAFDRGVAEGIRRSHNPGTPHLTLRTARPTPAKPAPTSDPTRIAARASQMQAAAIARGETLSNVEAFKLACIEAGVPVH